MKKIFKLTFAAVGLISLASCSNDDLFQNGAFNGLQDDKGTLVVSVERVNDEFGLSGVTRALSNEDMTNTVWQSSDKIKVYDSQLHIWDGYQFSGNKFALFTEADLTAPKYALYPFGKDEPTSNGSIEGTETIGGVWGTSWSKGGVTKATMRIPKEFTYEEGTMTDGTTPAFWCSIPKWGKVTATGDDKLEVELKNMVAILRISLQNAEGNVDHIKVSAFKDEAKTKRIRLYGDFEATLDTVDFTNTYLAEDLTFCEVGENELTVNVAELKAAQAYVFVPIVPCKNAVLQIDYYADDSDTPIPGKSKTLSQKNYVRNTLYKAKGPEFDVNVASPAAITKALNAAKAQTDPIEVKATVTINAIDNDNTITIPAGMKADQITLNLAEGLTNTGTNMLYIEDEDMENAYTGTVVLKNGGDATNTTINASLKKATLAYVGKFNAENNRNYVKGLVVGDNKTESLVKAGTLSDYIEAIDIKANATIDKLIFNETNKVASINVSGTVNGDISGSNNSYSKLNADVTVAVNDDVETPFAAVVNGAIRTKGNVTVKSGKATATTQGISNAGNVTVTKGTEDVTTGLIYSNVAKGSTVTISATGANIGSVLVPNATGTINVTDPAAFGKINAPKSSVTITNSSENVFNATSQITASELTLSGKVHATGTIATGDLTIKDESSIANATATGNVTISATKEMEVVSGTLTMKNEAAGSTLALNAGYVNNVALVAEDTKGDVTLTLGKAQTAIATVTNGSAKKFITSKSEWDGKAITATNHTFDKYRQATSIYTASQLASLAAEGNVELMTNIDLMGKANTKGWTCPALNANFNGNGKKISNLYLKAEVAADAETDKTNIGLFSTIAASKKVNDLTIETVTTALTDAKTNDAHTIKNVGALAGSATSVIVDKVTVTGAALTSDVKIENVGGLIGSTTGTVYIGYTSTGEASENAVAVTTTNIKGQYNLGGLIGVAGSAVYLNKTTATVGAINVVDHTNPTIGETENDPKAGSVGLFVGSLGGDLVLVGSSTYGTSKIDRNALGFKRNYYAKVDGGNLKVYYYYGGYDGVGIYTGTETLHVNGKSVNPSAELTERTTEAVNSELYNQYLLSTKW